MEDWTAADEAPRRYSPQRVEPCDLCVLLFAYRRGHVPEGGQQSITQLEYNAAMDRGIDVLAFLLRDETPWLSRFDERDRDPGVNQWRRELQEAHGVSFFELDPLSLDIEPALVRWILGRVGAPATRLPSSEDVDVAAPAALEVAVDSVSGSQVEVIYTDLTRILNAHGPHAVVVDLRNGSGWWSTRLYLLSSLVRDHTDASMLVFVDGDDGFVGAAEPRKVADSLVALHPDLAQRYTATIGGRSKADIVRAAVDEFVDGFASDEEVQMKSWVDADLLRHILEDDLITALIQVDDEKTVASRSLLLEIIRQDHPFVVLLAADGSVTSVVDRDRLARQVAEDQLKRD